MQSSSWDVGERLLYRVKGSEVKWGREMPLAPCIRITSESAPNSNLLWNQRSHQNWNLRHSCWYMIIRSVIRHAAGLLPTIYALLGWVKRFQMGQPVSSCRRFPRQALTSSFINGVAGCWCIDFLMRLERVQYIVVVIFPIKCNPCLAGCRSSSTISAMVSKLWARRCSFSIEYFTSD